MEITGEEYGQSMARYRQAGPWVLDDIRDYLEEREKGDRSLSSCDLCGTAIRYIHSVSNAKLERRGSLKLAAVAANAFVAANTHGRPKRNFAHGRPSGSRSCANARDCSTGMAGVRQPMAILKRTIGGRFACYSGNLRATVL